jgi:hypothetical protein
MKLLFKIFLILQIFVILIIFAYDYNLNTFNLFIKVFSSFLFQTKDINIFCFIKTNPSNLYTRVPQSYENCMKYCTDHRYVTVFDNKTLNLMYKFLYPSNWLKEDYGKLTTKVYNGFLDTKSFPLFDWYLFADDDTFVHMKNLFLFLNDKNKSSPVMYGHHFGAIGGFLSGGAGFVFSQESYKRLIHRLSTNITLCENGGIDDLDLSHCLKKSGSFIADTRDEYGYERFHSGNFDSHFYGDPSSALYANYKQYNGSKCSSKSWISFHTKQDERPWNQMIDYIDGMLRNQSNIFTTNATNSSLL